tara:strand:+ start:1111 stop:2118 length:1008 start_codon:yes stop_codon:yes gene_type:complete
MMNILVTGAAGFIGFHTSKRLSRMGFNVFGIDNFTDYYDVDLKKARLNELLEVNNFTFEDISINDSEKLKEIFRKSKFDRVIHLAAQPGVRYSIENPMIYGESNLIGHLNILELCRHFDIQHLVYASSSSVYGMKDNQVLSASNNVDHPVSLYAATKKSNELMTHVYSHLFNIPCTGLRFFTVYGPWGRPDMALFKFTKSILNGDPIYLNNNGDMKRDFTYIDDIVEGVTRVLEKIPVSNDTEINHDPSQSKIAPYKVFNIGRGKPQNLKDFVSVLEDSLGMKAKIEYREMQPGDVKTTHADTKALEDYIGYSPEISIEEGIKNFVQWYLKYYRL